MKPTLSTSISGELTPAQLILELQQVFPDFVVATAEHDEIYHPLSLHSIMAEFACWIGISLPRATEKEVAQFGSWLDSAVAAGGTLENAVSTCLLEHVHQLDIRKRMRPYVNDATKAAMRA